MKRWLIGVVGASGGLAAGTSRFGGDVRSDGSEGRGYRARNAPTPISCP